MDRPGFKFKTHWALTLLLAALGALFLSLGNWQRERAGEKRALQEDFDTARSVVALEPGLPDWTRAELVGGLDSRRHVLLDNKIHRGRAGVHVLTPFQPAGGPAVLVNRGWLPLPPDRSRLPAVPTPDETLVLSGRLAPLSRPGVQVGEPVEMETDRWPQLIVYPDWGRLEAALGLVLHRQVLYLDQNSPAGFGDRAWTPSTMTPDRHMAYAVQWYGLALAAVATWVVLGVNAGRRAAA